MIIESDNEHENLWEELFSLDTEYGSVRHLCPYCVHNLSDNDLYDRVLSHRVGSVPDECDYLMVASDGDEDVLKFVDSRASNESKGISYFVDEVTYDGDGLTYRFYLVQKCKYYKRIFLDYNEYINSEMWQQAREYALKRDGYKCVKCGSAKNVQVHHLVYKNIPYEKPGDIVTICKECHKKIHARDIEGKNNGRS